MLSTKSQAVALLVGTIAFAGCGGSSPAEGEANSTDNIDESKYKDLYMVAGRIGTSAEAQIAFDAMKVPAETKPGYETKFVGSGKVGLTCSHTTNPTTADQTATCEIMAITKAKTVPKQPPFTVGGSIASKLKAALPKSDLVTCTEATCTFQKGVVTFLSLEAMMRDTPNMTPDDKRELDEGIAASF